MKPCRHIRWIVLGRRVPVLSLRRWGGAIGSALKGHLRSWGYAILNVAWRWEKWRDGWFRCRQCGRLVNVRVHDCRLSCGRPPFPNARDIPLIVECWDCVEEERRRWRSQTGLADEPVAYLERP